MLLSQSATKFLEQWGEYCYKTEESDISLFQKLMIVLFQTLSRVLQHQNGNGSWGADEAEPTSYALLTLLNLAALPVASFLKPKIMQAVEKAREFLSRLPSARPPDYTWIEKVSYRSENIHRAYVLAALHAPVQREIPGANVSPFFDLPVAKFQQFRKLFRQLPLLDEMPGWVMEASLIEGFLFAPHLRNIRPDIFECKNLAEDKYLEYFSVVWTTTNNLRKAHLRGTFLQEMMLNSFLTFQTGDYMETLATAKFADIRQLIDDLLSKYEHTFTAVGPAGSLENEERMLNSAHEEQSNGLKGLIPMKRKLDADSSSMVQIENSLRSKTSALMEHPFFVFLKRFTDFVTDHATRRKANEQDKSMLLYEFRAFLFTRVDKSQGKLPLSSNDVSLERSRHSIFNWVRHTGADHTSCSYSSVFAKCLMSTDENVFESGRDGYLWEAVCRHLANVCKAHKDLAHLSLDPTGRNLNSLEFGKLFVGKSQTNEVIEDELLTIAQYERKCLQMAMADLRKRSPSSTMRMVEAFVDVNEVFGQTYIL